MPIGERHGQRIGSVSWFGPLREPEFPLNGRLNLFLAGVAAHGQGAFDTVGEVVVDRQPCLGPCQANHASGMAQEDRGLGEPCMGKDLFDGHRRRTKGVEHFSDARVDLRQPFLDGLAPRTHRAGLDEF